MSSKHMTAPKYRHRRLTHEALIVEAGRLSDENSRLHKRRIIPPGGIAINHTDLRRLAGALHFLEDSATVDIDGKAVPLKNCGAFRTILGILAGAPVSFSKPDPVKMETVGR
jgi:hypothetical protein